MSGRPIRVAVFGGKRGTAFLQPIASTAGFTLCCVCEKDESILSGLRGKVPEETVLCGSFDELLETKPDAVVLANYFHEHGLYAIRAMEAGVDVISETTAAPTPDLCLRLLETQERTGRKYMLAANCPGMPGPEELGRVYRTGELGEVLYAEAEYLHILDYNDDDVRASLSPEDSHWRRYLPSTYYNMHSLGVLMAATGLSPRRVTAMEICTPDGAASCYPGSNPTMGGIALYGMSSGAVFRSTGCCHMGPNGKWFRLTCANGTVETVRTDQDRVLLRKNGTEAVEYVPEHVYTEEEKLGGHGGADTRMCRAMCRWLKGEGAPVMDIYQAVELSLAGIYGLYSILDGRAYDIPDPRDKAAREVLRGDTRMPFPDAEGRLTLPNYRGR